MIKSKNKFPTLREIQEAHGCKRDYEKYLPLSRFVFRPAGFLITWLAIRIGLTTEGVAWLSGIVGITACLLLIIGSDSLLPIGIALLLFFNLLDCVDGSIARTTKTENPYGRFLDSLMGTIDIGFWAVIGIMAYNNPKFLFFPNPFDHGPIFWLAVGGLTCYFFILVEYIERIFDVAVREEWNSIRKSIEIDSKTTMQDRTDIETIDKKTLSFKLMSIIRIINHNLRVRETHYFLLILAYLANSVDLFLASFLIYYFLYTIFLIVIYSLRGRQVRNYL